MSDGNLLRVMLLKEIRMTLRERSQVFRVAMSFVILLLVLGNSFYTVSRVSHRNRPIHVHPETEQEHSAREVTAHWEAIAGAAGGGFVFSSGYLIAAILACFVGEKENRTLEVLLASPLSDAKLFLLKSASVLVPSALMGSAFALVGVLAVGAMFSATGLTILQFLLLGLSLGLPALILIQACIVGQGAAISVKAETMKGAGQTLGAVLTLSVFGLIYGLPMLFRAVPSIQEPLSEALRSWMQLSFPLQYGLLLAALFVAATLLLSIGRILFRRDRMLA
jgi:ABC-type transport system involved in multi-copper enzyme maturation permease subunit